MATRVGLAKIWMTIWSADPQNPQFGAKFLYLSQMRAELLWFLCGNFKIFVIMATGVGLTQISLTQLNQQTPKTPYLVQESWYLLYKLSIGRFCVQMTSACCHGNKGGSNRNLNNTIWLLDPENLQFGANILHVSLTVPALWLFEVAIGRNANFQILGAKGG